jgi:hypothetical protein
MGERAVEYVDGGVCTAVVVGFSRGIDAKKIDRLFSRCV